MHSNKQESTISYPASDGRRAQHHGCVAQFAFDRRWDSDPVQSVPDDSVQWPLSGLQRGRFCISMVPPSPLSVGGPELSFKGPDLSFKTPDLSFKVLICLLKS